MSAQVKVYVRPQSGLSRAMDRSARALARYAPSWVQITKDRLEADLVVLHVIGYPETQQAVEELVAHGKKYAIMQYCLQSTQKPSTQDWLSVWQGAKAVWSYYDLEVALCSDHNDMHAAWKVPFYHAPLGIDDAFRTEVDEALQQRTIGAMTSGYVAGVPAEAIEEVYLACKQSGLETLHLGPSTVARMETPQSLWRAVLGISDVELRTELWRTKWVSGLRYVEGFELPALEGLCCGTRPILFDRPEMRKWYDGHAVFVEETYGEALIKQLVDLFRHDPVPVDRRERRHVLEKFNWQTLVGNFWQVARRSM